MTDPTILRDFLIAGTPLRGLIVRGPFSLCAYLGVPRDHWMARMEELDFPCHWGVTFSAEGEGGLRPLDWYWYGWDYGHAGDALELPPELEALMPAELRPSQRGKRWTVDEVEHEVIDAALALHEQMQQACAQAELTLACKDTFGPKAP